jgi:hypothetical protein
LRLWFWFWLSLRLIIHLCSGFVAYVLRLWFFTFCVAGCLIYDDCHGHQCWSPSFAGMSTTKKMKRRPSQSFVGLVGFFLWILCGWIMVYL